MRVGEAGLLALVQRHATLRLEHVDLRAKVAGTWHGVPVSLCITSDATFGAGRVPRAFFTAATARCRVALPNGFGITPAHVGVGVAKRPRTPIVALADAELERVWAVHGALPEACQAFVSEPALRHTLLVAAQRHPVMSVADGDVSITVPGVFTDPGKLELLLGMAVEIVAALETATKSPTMQRFIASSGYKQAWVLPPNRDRSNASLIILIFLLPNVALAGYWLPAFAGYTHPAARLAAIALCSLPVFALSIRQWPAHAHLLLDDGILRVAGTTRASFPLVTTRFRLGPWIDRGVTRGTLLYIENDEDRFVVGGQGFNLDPARYETPAGKHRGVEMRRDEFAELLWRLEWAKAEAGGA